MMRQKNYYAGNKEILDKIADFLFEKETITGKEFMEIYNKVRGIEPEENTETKSETKDTIHLDKKNENEYSTYELENEKSTIDGSIIEKKSSEDSPNIDSLKQVEKKNELPSQTANQEAESVNQHNNQDKPERDSKPELID